MDIDIVILWVDGNDPKWRAEREKYLIEKGEYGNRDFRFRDWSNLQFWFRGVEKFAPWVRKIHFVTWGHIPPWLNLEHPKLHIVNHADFMDAKNLPCFNSEAIEICLHKIEGLAEHFIYFNDDTFILKKVKPDVFFKKSLPCECAVLNVHCCELEVGGTLAHFLDIGIINRHFRMKKVLKENWSKWFNLKYGFNMLRNFYLLPCPRFPGMLMQHLANSFTKSTFYTVWEKEPEILEETCSHRFRSLCAVNQWIFKEWQLASGKFMPRRCNIGVSLLARDVDKACKIIERQKYKMLSFNDEQMTDQEFEASKEKIINSFSKILPDKSLYEK